MELIVAGKNVSAATGGRAFDAARPVLVFVHGAGFDGSVWRLLARCSARLGYSVLAVDLPGHGNSDGPPLGSIVDQGDWLAELIEASGAPRAALVGHSMGGLAALACASLHPGRATHAALLGVSERMSVHPELLAAAEANDHRAIDMVGGWSFAPAAGDTSRAVRRSRLMRRALRTLERAGPGVLHADLSACDSFQGAGPLATKVECPVLFVLGDRDKMTQVEGAYPLIGAVADPKVEILSGAGHMMMMEQPRATFQALEAFLPPPDESS